MPRPSAGCWSGSAQVGWPDLAGGDPAGATTVAVDGKSARGSPNGHVPSAHLLAAMTGDGQTISQLRVPDKTNEITGFARLLAPFDLTGIVVTADALHTQREHVRFLTRDKQAHYLPVVKNNQPSLFTALRSLPWSQVAARHAARSRGHGRRELRVVKALTVDGLELDFPGAVQAARIMHFRTNAGTGRLTRKTIYAITDLPSTQASPQQLGELARSHWGIENRLHFVRDTTFAEDASRIRTGRGPENMATLRNLAVSTLRRAGHQNIAAALRHVSYQPFTRPLDLLGIS
ncbi:ISAs1 family transposase [Streptomyces sp. P1-3]|uniref:ISAs1 family transposase n=1 Tax=Streptomyces sp. P1-3 TaxID=3421658 RepID=UPI003D35C5A6